MQREFNSTYRFFFSLKRAEKGNVINPDSVDQQELKKQESKQESSNDKLPGISLHMDIRIITNPVQRRKYLIDFGHVDGPRFSVYLSSDDVFTLVFVDNKKEPHPVQISLGGNGIPLGRFFYLGCELGIGGNFMLLHILVDGKEMRRLELPFKIDLGELDVPSGVIGADLNGANGGWFDIAELVVYSATMLPHEVADMKRHFDINPSDAYVEYRGNQWMRIQKIVPHNAIQKDELHAPRYHKGR